MVDEGFLVEFLKDKNIKVKPGQTILAASLEAGIPHYHMCGGNGKCSTCRILVLEGMNFLSHKSDKEMALVKEYKLPPQVRLACQAKVTGEPVKIQRTIRDDSDKELYLHTREKRLPYERELVLMFLDIRNFTPFTAAFLPFDVVHVLKKMLRIFESAINKYGGKIIETQGDGLYAIFGMQSELPHAARSAVKASMEILQQVKQFNDQYLTICFHHMLQIGIGLHAGKVVVGNIIINKKNHMIVMGYPVNIASRIETATRLLNNNFLVSEKLASLIFGCDSQKVAQVIRLKGVVEDIRVYSLGEKYE